MDILQYGFLGLIAGWTASVVMRTDSFKGMLMDVILGMFGAITGGVIMYLLDQSGVLAETQWYSGLLAAAGSVLWITVGYKMKLV